MHVFKQGVERLPRGGRTRRALLLHDRVGGDAAINASGTVERPTVESYPTYPVIVGLKRSFTYMMAIWPIVVLASREAWSERGELHVHPPDAHTQSQHWGQTACPICY